MSGAHVVTEDLILAKVSAKSFERGKDYYESGLVESVVQRGSRLYAEVLGSEEDPYWVGVILQEDDFTASCTCPYDWGGYCKHIVAALLTYVHDTELVILRAPIEDMLSRLDTGRLRVLILQMIEADPQLSETVDEFCQQGVSAM